MTSPRPTNTPLDEHNLAQALAELPGWRRTGHRLERDYRFPDFQSAMLFLQGAAFAAQDLDHHPDWSGSYDRVSIALTTHSAKALTALDIELAKRLEPLARRLGAS